MILSNTCFATNKEEVKKIIDKAESIGDEVENNSLLKEFIPFDVYSDALLHIIYARNQLDKKKYDSAYFYGAISIIKFETATVFAQAKKTEYDRIVLERDFFRDQKGLKTANSTLRYLINANLEKRGNAFRIIFLDKFLFSKKSKRLNKVGEKRLSKILPILRGFPRCKIKVISHSYYYDNKFYTQHKANRILKYFRQNGIKRNRLNAIGMGNKEVVETYLGYRRVNRIELVISGINL